MKNLFLKLGSYYRYLVNTPPNDLDLGNPNYELPIGKPHLIEEDWHLRRNWGGSEDVDIHPKAGRGDGQENFYVASGCVALEPRSVNLYTWASLRPDLPVDWACGMLWSKVEFGWGYTEVCVVMEEHIGAWEAPLWFFKNDGTKTREVDVNETYVRHDKKTHLNSAMHFYGDRKSHRAQHHPLRKPFGRSVRFGVFREPNWASVYYDGHMVRRERIDHFEYMPAIISTGMMGGIPNSERGVMKVYSFKHWEL